MLFVIPAFVILFTIYFLFKVGFVFLWFILLALISAGIFWGILYFFKIDRYYPNRLRMIFQSSFIAFYFLFILIKDERLNLMFWVVSVFFTILGFLIRNPDGKRLAGYVAGVLTFLGIITSYDPIKDFLIKIVPM